MKNFLFFMDFVYVFLAQDCHFLKGKSLKTRVVLKKIRAFGIAQRLVNQMNAVLTGNIGGMHATYIVENLKGFDIRQVLRCRDGTIRLIDPGKTKIGCIENDVAKFIVTSRLVHLGLAVAWRGP